LVEFYPRRVR